MGELKKNGFMKFFPYSPYPQQKEFMVDAENVLSEQGVLLAEACNGFGKTACALAVGFSLGRRIIYATRTHEQVRQVLYEVERINETAGTEFKAVSLASRRNLCLNPDVRRLPRREAVEVCNRMRKDGECPYRTDFETHFPPYLPPVLSVEKLLAVGKTGRYCPYFLARRVAQFSTVAVAPYQYIFNRVIRAKIRLGLDGKLLIFDEAHNADTIAQEVLSDTLSKRSLDVAEEELEQIDRPSQFTHRLKEYIERNVSDESEPKVKAGRCLRDDLEKLLRNLSVSVKTMKDLVDEIREHKNERGEVPICFLNGVASFLGLVASSNHECYVAIYRRSRLGLKMIKYLCLDPSLAIHPVVKETYAALIMSGTLTPMNLFKQIIGLPEAHTETYSSIAKPENIHTTIDVSVTTRYKERTRRMLQKIGERIEKTISQTSYGSLIFLPQKQLMREAVQNWTTKVGKRRFFGGKQVFVEGSWAAENTKIVSKYKEAARTVGAVLFTVFRGRNAEGSNFPYNESRNIFLVGLPYADYSDPVVKAQIEYFNGKQQRLGTFWYLMDAFRAANQAMGRGIRHRDDMCNFYLMDRRYASNKRFISKWAIENGVRTVD